MIAVAAALFIGLVTLYARTMHPPSAQDRARFDQRGRGDRPDRFNRGNRRGRGDRGEGGDDRKRPNNAELSRFPEIFKEGGLFAVVTFAGRRILRLRL